MEQHYMSTESASVSCPPTLQEANIGTAFICHSARKLRQIMAILKHKKTGDIMTKNNASLLLTQARDTSASAKNNTSSKRTIRLFLKDTPAGDSCTTSTLKFVIVILDTLFHNSAHTPYTWNYVLFKFDKKRIFKK
jgi:hypothetical protein